MNSRANLLSLRPYQWAFCACSLVYAPLGVASGYHFGTQSVSTQSTANASTAEAADASAIFYNPAGISQLEGTNISINANLVMPSVHYENASANYPDGTAVSGQTSGKISKSAVVVPHLYATHQLSDNWTAGLGIYVPFASGTEFQRDSVLRYNVNKMELTSIDINPTLSYKINDNQSFAIGLVGQYAAAELRQYANLGRLAGLPNGIDSYAKVEGDDWGFGYTLGIYGTLMIRFASGRATALKLSTRSPAPPNGTQTTPLMPMPR